MAYDLQEQEQIDEFKAWWTKYGNNLMTVLIIVLLAVAGWRAWGWYQQNQASKAAVLYETLKQSAIKKDFVKAKEASAQIFENYGSTAYGQMAALMMARAHIDNGNDVKSAKLLLQWAIDKSKDEEFAHTARLRMAGILLDEKAYDEGLKVLAVTPTETYLPLYADRRGDLLLASGKATEAKAAYKEAIAKLEERSPIKELVKLKYDALGGDAS